MKSPILRLAVATLLLGPSLVTAHEPTQHKGTPTEGEVVSVAGEQVMLKTATHTLTVILTDSTTFERAGKPTARTDLTRGCHVSVFGTKLATGELVAREFIIEASGNHGAHPTPAGGDR